MYEPGAATPGGFPLIGRATELELIRTLLKQAESGASGTLILFGGSGVGKSKLLQWAATDATRTGWTTVVGRAYPVESGIPYSPFADAFVPLLRTLPPEALATLTRGSEAELAHLFPVLRGSERPDLPAADAAELKTRLLWNFSQFLSRLSRRQPLLVVLDDLQWADASSLELLHFVARQAGGDHVALLCAYNDAFSPENPQLSALEQSLTAIGAARTHCVGPLSHGETALLIRHQFAAGEAATREFSALLFGWTRGNPFFLEETLKTLVDSGRLRQVDGSWVGWDLENIDLPRSIREAVLSRLRALSSEARLLADTLAVIGTHVTHDALLAVSALEEGQVFSAVEELRRHRLLEERLDAGAIIYDFTHPIMREVLHAELGLARQRLLHERVAEALEAFFGPAALDHAGELAYHFARATGRELTPKAIRYLAAAGRQALEKYSNREAADYLTAAWERTSESEAAYAEPALLEDLARARQRLGEFDAASALWGQRLAIAAAEGDASTIARVHRRLGLLEYWRGQYFEAIEHFDAGLEAAGESSDEKLRARLHLARGEASMELGRPGEALDEMEAALVIAERHGDPELLARVQLALLLLHIWTGPPERARAHGDRGLAIAVELGDAGLRSTLHWGMALLAGATGDAAAMSAQLAECERLAEELRSPLHRLRAAEVAIEFLANTGDWQAAVDLAERTISTARALNQRTFLSRILVWTGLLYFGRGDVARGKRYVDEAWQLSGAGRVDQPIDVHTVVPAHVGLAGYHIAIGEFAEAARVGEAGLAIADRTGYAVWAIHRLLPAIAEAYLSMGDLEGAARTGARLRADSERLGHQLGLAWADACDALLVWLRGDIATGVSRLGAAADRLESIPAIPDAARLRRHFAARLRDQGDREGALRELRHIHEVFLRLGAERELAKTREQIRELGARPPLKEVAQGVEGLSGREIEIARLVALGKSNKTIGKMLEISPRTVSTHLSNIFSKLEIGSRGELAEFVRRQKGEGVSQR